jgi:ABC-type phosphate/phosphonate transport system substrate-binding protein
MRSLLGLGIARREVAASAPFLRLSISDSLLGEANLNDARAAMKVWISRVMQDVQARVDINAEFFERFEVIAHKLESGALDSAALNAVEYWRLRPMFDPSILACPTYTGTQQLQVLVRRDAGYQSIADLKNKRLMVHQSPRMSTAMAWLHLLTVPHGGPVGARFFADIQHASRPQQVVLSVFFRKAEACLILAPVVSPLGELNPQLSKQLVAIETSPELVAGAYALSKQTHPKAKQILAGSMSLMAESVSGRQVLSLFQLQDLRIRNASHMYPTMDLIDKAVAKGWQDEHGIVRGATS